jgi:hypothetical protein
VTIAGCSGRWNRHTDVQRHAHVVGGMEHVLIVAETAPEFHRWSGAVGRLPRTRLAAGSGQAGETWKRS